MKSSPAIQDQSLTMLLRPPLCRKPKLSMTMHAKQTKSYPSKKTPSSMSTTFQIQTGPLWALAETTGSLQPTTLSLSRVEHRQQRQQQQSHCLGCLHAVLQLPSQRTSRTLQHQTALPTQALPLLSPASSRKSLNSKQPHARRSLPLRMWPQPPESASSSLQKSLMRKRRRLAYPTDPPRSRSRPNPSTLLRARLRLIGSGHLQPEALHLMCMILHRATTSPAHLSQALGTIYTTSTNT
jgi:hypothetical protein